MRIQPAAQFIPKATIESCVIDGYHIPAKTMVLVNVWAIGRDLKFGISRTNLFLRDLWALTLIWEDKTLNLYHLVPAEEFVQGYTWQCLVCSLH